VELVELGPLSARDWDVVLDGEDEPFGAVGHRLEWRVKDRHVGLRRDDGRLVAIAGAAVVELEIEGAGEFEVVGIGSVVVTQAERGRGLLAQVFEPILRIAGEMGPERAVLFCRPQLVPVYERWGFATIGDQAWADQPGGRMEIPLAFMWRALRNGVDWPTGRVDVRGLPF
jgi:predicted GNAT family N-acyltransferase